jgi:hypothetical protein
MKPSSKARSQKNLPTPIFSEANKINLHAKHRPVYIYAMIDTQRIDNYISSAEFDPTSQTIPDKYRCIRMVDNVLSAEFSDQGSEDIHVAMDPGTNVEITLLTFRPERENQLFITAVTPKNPNLNVFNPQLKSYYEGNAFFGTVADMKTGEDGSGYNIYFQYRNYSFYWDPIFKVPRGAHA